MKKGSGVGHHDLLEDHDDDDHERPKEYNWEKDSLLLASESAVGERLDGAMRFGGTAFVGEEPNVDPSTVYRRGLSRAVVVGFDWGMSMLQPEPSPSRSAFVASQIVEFVTQFFATNPLSQMCLAASCDSTATRITPLSSSPQSHLDAFKSFCEKDCSGEVSLQHLVNLAIAQLKHCPVHVSREVLLVWSSLTSCDAGDLFASVQEAKACGIKISVIHLSAEMYAAHKMCDLTGGMHGVMIDKQHCAALFAAQVRPPLSFVRTSHVALVPTGFPVPSTTPSLCVCHKRLQSVIFHCPKCRASVCELPSSCPVCGLQLVAASHLARSFRHLHPVPISEPKLPNVPKCVGCASSLPNLVPVQTCTVCHAQFCVTCSEYARRSLFNCPTCAIKNS